MRYLGIDHGDRYVGLAMSDPSATLASGFGVIDRRKENPYIKIKNIVREYDIKKIIVGYPINMTGTHSAQCTKVDEFVEHLQDCAEIILCDERWTTLEADRFMLEADLSRQKRKDRIDTLSACIILQTHLDKLRHECTKDS